MPENKKEKVCKACGGKGITMTKYGEVSCCFKCMGTGKI